MASNNLKEKFIKGCTAVGGQLLKKDDTIVCEFKQGVIELHKDGSWVLVKSLSKGYHAIPSTKWSRKKVRITIGRPKEIDYKDHIFKMVLEGCEDMPVVVAPHEGIFLNPEYIDPELVEEWYKEKERIKKRFEEFREGLRTNPPKNWNEVLERLERVWKG